MPLPAHLLHAMMSATLRCALGVERGFSMIIPRDCDARSRHTRHV
jgi:hypothetical protein